MHVCVRVPGVRACVRRASCVTSLNSFMWWCLNVQPQLDRTVVLPSTTVYNVLKAVCRDLHGGNPWWLEGNFQRFAALHNDAYVQLPTTYDTGMRQMPVGALASTVQLQKVLHVSIADVKAAMAYQVCSMRCCCYNVMSFCPEYLVRAPARLTVCAVCFVALRFV